MVKKVPKIFSNFYFLTGLFFVIWMLFINSTDVFSYIELKMKLSELTDQKIFYENRIKQVEMDREALLNNEELLEKFAREKYLMKRPAEDVFIIVEKE